MRPSVLAAIALAATTVGGAAGLASASAPAASVASAASTTTGDSRTVTLPTGDRVRLGTVDGRARQQVRAAGAGLAASFEQIVAGGDSYVFPAEARPFLGGVLDPSLFDVTALSAARVPVTFTAPAGVTVPGVTVMSRSGSVAQGVVSATGAFRAALVAAYRQVAHPGAAAPKSLFGGVTHLAVTGATPPVAPSYPQVTLVINVRDASGAPAAGGVVGVINTDNGRKYANFAFFQNGQARISVPTGDYSAITDVGEFDDRTGVYSDWIIPKADFAVTKNLQTISLDARDATVTPSVSTPQPADVQSESLEFDRSDATGAGSLGYSFSFDGSSRVRVAPTGYVRVGTLNWVTGWTLTGGEPAGTPYSYDLSYVTQGRVPADEADTVRDFQLATVDSTYYNDHATDQSLFVRTPIYPFQFAVFSEFLPLPTPTHRTEYVFGRSDAVWTASLLADPTDFNPFGGAVDDDYRVYPSGYTTSAEWLRGPLTPAPPEQTSGDSFYGCLDCRTDKSMFVLLEPVTDTTPGHVGELYDPASGPATHFALYRDGTRISAGADRIGARVPVPATLSTYRLHLDVSRAADHPKTSTSTSTDLVFKSSATNGGALPAGWGCVLTDGTCRTLTLLKATVPLPTTLVDRMPQGASTFVMTIAPFRGAGPATITSATFAMSIDGGASFTAADVRRIDNNHYRVTITNPATAAGKGVTIRVHATDDAGDAITQTTRNAYLVAAS